jgi:DNA ligase-1
MISKPMLAVAAKNMSAIKFPVLVSPKLDGIRCLKLNGQVVSRKLKPIPNTFIREWMEANLPDGIDGEIMIRNATFSQIQSGVMTEAGCPDFEFHAFDLVGDISTPFETRYANLSKFIETNDNLKDRLKLVTHIIASSVDEISQLETDYLELGYEGAMIRSLSGPYKNGRSTEKEGYLLKVKQFEDSEAEIFGSEVLFHNSNEATIDELGHTKRSSHKANMIPTDKLGAFIVKDIHSNIEFRISTGMTEAERRLFWSTKDDLIGEIIKYKFQPSGMKDLPRFPVFLGFRDRLDMD